MQRQATNPPPIIVDSKRQDAFSMKLAIVLADADIAKRTCYPTTGIDISGLGHLI